MDPDEAVLRARGYYLADSHIHGCAETAFIVLKEAYGLPDPQDSTAAMALNGGVAYSGSVCGAISGAAMALGMLAGRRISDHRLAKRTARRLVAKMMDEYQLAFGSTQCRDLIELDIRDEGQHRLFLESGIWRTCCMQQVEFTVGWFAPLGEPAAWQAAVTALDAASET